MLPYSRQSVDKRDTDFVLNAMTSDYLTTGPYVEKFEKKLAEKTSAEYAVSFSSGTAALHAAMFAIGIKPGDEVITTPMTFVATANAISYMGGVPVFVDVDPDTLLIDVDKIEEKLTKKTKAIITVDYAGQPVDYDRILNLANFYGLWFVSDSCHSLGAKYKCEPIGSQAHIHCFSFHATKAITTLGEGGACTTNCESVKILLESFRNHGRENGEMYHLGYNYRLSDPACAMGISQLDKLDGFVERRREIAVKYYCDLLNVKEIKTLSRSTWGHAFHLYVIKAKDRDRLKNYLATQGIETQIHYKPITMQPYHLSWFSDNDCPIAEQEWENILSLPCHPSMTDEDINKVIDTVKTFYGG